MYTYGELLDDVNYLSRFGVETGAIGASVYGRIIPYVRLGNGNHSVIVTAGIHAREHVGTLFAIKQLYKILSDDIGFKLYFVPMLNPDGNVLVSDGADAFGFDKGKLIALNGGNADFSLWKANAAGVDLNVNFDAMWGSGRQNVRTAGAENYIGAYAFSEPETRAIADFTKKLQPVLTLSYHAKGQVIYYEFGQEKESLERDRAVAEYAAALTGYKLIHGTAESAGGYKDWCVSRLGIPSFTLELVSDSFTHPIPDTGLNADFAREPILPVKLYKYMAESGFLP